MVNRRPQLQLVAPAASPDEAAAIVAALERFMRETAAAYSAEPRAIDPWIRAALTEGTSRGSSPDEPDPWINT